VLLEDFFFIFNELCHSHPINLRAILQWLDVLCPNFWGPNGIPPYWERIRWAMETSTHCHEK